MQLVNKTTVETLVGKHLNKAMETTYSVASLSIKVNTFVDNDVQGIDVVANKLGQYISDIAISKIPHAIWHYELLGGMKYTLDSVINKALKVLIRAEVMDKKGGSGDSYIDYNVVANTLGKKLAPKYFMQGGVKVKSNAETKLSIGLNIYHFLAYTAGIAHIDSFVNEEGHTIKRISSNIVLPVELDKLRAIRRAGTPMTCKPVEHTIDKVGGFTLDSKTMLDSDGYNSNQTQSEEVCEALNKAQNVAYRLRSEVPMIGDYVNHEKWLNASGVFMQGEWDKFTHDINVLSNRDFYFPMALDDRGRTYDRGNYVKMQGDSTQKAMREFSNKYKLDARGEYYLKCSIASELYSDKVETQEAVEWFDKHTLEELEAMEQTTGSSVLLMDWKEHLEGKAVGSIVHYDATNSGLQMYSILGRDTLAAGLCNVIALNKIADAYRELADALNKLLSTEIFNRDNVKHSFMVFLYGAGQGVILAGKAIDVDKSGDILYLFDKLGVTAEDAWGIFSEAMYEIAPSAIEMMNLIYTFRNKEGSKYNWVMPDDFQVEVTNTKVHKIEGHYIDMKFECTHKGTLEVKLEEHGKDKSKALAPNIIHSIDGYILRELVRRCGFEVEIIHDSFGCHPINVDAMLAHYRDILAEVLEMNLLENILEQINPSAYEAAVRMNKFTKGDLTADMVRNSINALR